MNADAITALSPELVAQVGISVAAFEDEWHRKYGWGNPWPSLSIIGTYLDGDGFGNHDTIVSRLKLPESFWLGPVPAIAVNPVDALAALVERTERNPRALARFFIEHASEGVRASCPVGIAYMLIGSGPDGDTVRAVHAIDLDMRIYDILRRRYGRPRMYRRMTTPEQVERDVLEIAQEEPEVLTAPDGVLRTVRLLVRLMGTFRGLAPDTFGGTGADCP